MKPTIFYIGIYIILIMQVGASSSVTGAVIGTIVLDTTPPIITIDSPLNNSTNPIDSVNLNYSVNEPTKWEGYSLDGAENVTLSGNTTLTGLSEGTHTLTVYANDTSGNMNSSTVWFTIMGDTEAPKYSKLSVNNTEAGKATLFSAYWTDNVELRGYIFSTNNSGTWINDSYVEFTGNGNWSNITKILNSTVGLTIGWRIYATDTSDNWNDTGIQTLIPLGVYVNNSVNLTANTTTTIDARNETDTIFEIYTNESVFNSSLEIIEYVDTPPNTGSMFGIQSVKFAEINASQAIKSHLEWVVIKLYYTDEEISTLGLEESELKLYWWNETSYEWIELNPSLEWVYDTGVNTVDNFVWANVTHFSVYALGGDNIPPIITIDSPLNDSTNPIDSVNLNYSVTEPTEWEGYSLDGAENVTLSGNTTLTGLSKGTHTLAVYANDTAGNLNSSTVWFTMVRPKGKVKIKVIPKTSKATAGSTVYLNISVDSTENFDDTFYVYLDNTSINPPSRRADLTWFNWTSRYVEIPAGGEANLPLKADIPIGVSPGIKKFHVMVESTKWTSKAMDTGRIRIMKSKKF